MHGDIMQLERVEVVERLTAALSSTLGVERAAYFGSAATGHVDVLSDIDLVVQCEAEAASRFVRRLHGMLEVVLYRPFSENCPPAGRYWFAAANPFLRLDVSFYARPEFEELMVHGIGPKQPPFAPIFLGWHGSSVAPSRALPEWSDLDYDFAGALRQFHESAKAVFRGREPKRPLVKAYDDVRWFESTELRRDAWQLYERSTSYLPSSA